MTYISDIKNEKARGLFRRFWNLTDNLHYDIDKLSFDNFAVKYKEMWSTLDRAMDLEGKDIMVNISNLTDKARQKYGLMFKNKYEIRNVEVV